RPSRMLALTTPLVALALAIFGASGAWAFGELAQKPGAGGCITADGAGGACGKASPLSIPAGVLVSRDGKSAYVASSNGLAVLGFDRDPATGTLTQKAGQAGCTSETGNGGACAHGFSLVSPVDLAESPDGKDVYVPTVNSSSIDVFERSDATGALTEIGCLSQRGSEGHCSLSRGLSNAEEVVVSPDGDEVYVASFGSDAVAVFDRQPNGLLAQKPGKEGCIALTEAEGCEKARGLDGASGLAISPD